MITSFLVIFFFSWLIFFFCRRQQKKILSQEKKITHQQTKLLIQRKHLYAYDMKFLCQSCHINFRGYQKHFWNIVVFSVKTKKTKFLWCRSVCTPKPKIEISMMYAVVYSKSIPNTERYYLNTPSDFSQKWRIRQIHVKYPHD